MQVHRSAITAATVAAAVLSLAACSSGSTSTSASPTASETSSAAATTSAAITTATAAASAPVGAGCAGYAEKVPSGPGSVAGMAAGSVTAATANSPVLTTLNSALSGKLNPGVNLIDTLNNGQFTVFAPTDEAFAKIDAATIEKLKTDSALLTSILTYHVVPGQATPAQVVGEHKTVQGATVKVTGTPDNLKVNDAGVVCGGVTTTNAQVYLIDTVLMPPAQ
ncbi:MAG: fasciclin domain-containing protein [Mycobacterium sp.]|nr:fasciclin domain-containing protein [Mycobacterium sp.]